MNFQVRKNQILREKEEFKNRSFEVSQKKLINLYEKCGFRLIEGEKFNSRFV